MTDFELRVLRSLLSVLNALADSVQRIAKQNGSNGSQQNPPPQINIQPEIGVPPAVTDYYTAENAERPQKSLRECIRLCLEILTFTAALAAAFFTGLTWNQIKLQTASIKMSAEAADVAAKASSRQVELMQTTMSPILNLGVIFVPPDASLYITNTGSTAAIKFSGSATTIVMNPSSGKTRYTQTSNFSELRIISGSRPIIKIVASGIPSNEQFASTGEVLIMRATFSYDDVFGKSYPSVSFCQAQGVRRGNGAGFEGVAIDCDNLRNDPRYKLLGQ